MSGAWDVLSMRDIFIKIPCQLQHFQCTQVQQLKHMVAPVTAYAQATIVGRAILVSTYTVAGLST